MIFSLLLYSLENEMLKNECTQLMQADADKSKLPIWGIWLSILVSLASAIKYQDWHFIFIAIFAIGMLYLSRYKNISNYFLLSFTLLVYLYTQSIKSIVAQPITLITWLFGFCVMAYLIKYLISFLQK